MDPTGQIVGLGEGFKSCPACDPNCVACGDEFYDPTAKVKIKVNLVREYPRGTPDNYGIPNGDPAEYKEDLDATYAGIYDVNYDGEGCPTWFWRANPEPPYPAGDKLYGEIQASYSCAKKCWYFSVVSEPHPHMCL